MCAVHRRILLRAIKPLSALLNALSGCGCCRESSSVMSCNERAAVQQRSKMSSAESTNGISRRAVLAGAAAIGGTIAVASALGTGVTTAQVSPRTNVHRPKGKVKAKGRSIKLHTAKVRIYSCLAKRSATFLLYLQQFSFFFLKITPKKAKNSRMMLLF